MKNFFEFLKRNIRIGIIAFVICLGILIPVCIYSNYNVDKLRNEYVPSERAKIIKERVEILEREIEQLKEQRSAFLTLKEKNINIIGKSFTFSIEMKSNSSGYNKEIYNNLCCSYINDYKWLLNYDKLADITGMSIETVKNCIWNTNTSYDGIVAETVIIFNVVACEEYYTEFEQEFLSWIEEENKRLSKNIMVHDIKVLNIQNIDVDKLFEDILTDEFANRVNKVEISTANLAADELRYVNGEETDYFWDEGYFYRLVVSIAIFVSILFLLIRYVTEDEKYSNEDLEK